MLFNRKNVNKKMYEKEAQKLVVEANFLANIVNNTTNEDEFFSSLERLEKIFLELITYEKFVKFKISPRKDYGELKRNRKKAIKAFRERIEEKNLFEENHNLSLSEIEQKVKNVTLGI